MIKQPTAIDFTLIVNEIWNSIIHLQNIFSTPNSRGSLSVDESYQIVLRDLFSHFREYSTMDQAASAAGSNSSPERLKFNRLQQYSKALEKFWLENKNVAITSRNSELLKETREALARIIQLNRSNFDDFTQKNVDDFSQNQRSHQLQLQIQKLHEDNNKQTIRISVLEMENDALKRRQNKDREVKIQSSQLEQANRTTEKLQLRLAELDQKNIQLKNDNEQLKLNVSSQKRIIDDLQNQLARPSKGDQKLISDQQILQTENRKLKEQAKSLSDQLKLLEMKQKQGDPELSKKYERAIEENQILSLKIDELYEYFNEQIDLKYKNDLLNKINDLELEKSKMAFSLQKAGDEKKMMAVQIENLKQQIAERVQEEPEILVVDQELKNDDWIPNIKFLPELSQGSHLAPVFLILFLVKGFNTLLENNEDPVVQSLNKIMQVMKDERPMTEVNANVKEIVSQIQIEVQNDNRANDYLFQVIDYLSRAILKSAEEEEKGRSEIAKIIQAADSPIFDKFFFLQRIYNLSDEIHTSEVPLINSIKQVRWIPSLGKECEKLSQYLTKLAVLEGNDNGGAAFNYVVLPQVLILNVYELSNARANLPIDLEISSKAINLEVQPENEVKYVLTGIVHSSAGEIPGSQSDMLYYLTIFIQDRWVQVLNQQYIIFTNINELLTFKKKQNDKEMLIYQRI